MGAVRYAVARRSSVRSDVMYAGTMSHPCLPFVAALAVLASPLSPSASADDAPARFAEVPVTHRIPAGWAPTPARSSMRLAQFVTAPDSEHPVVVYWFGAGNGGGKAANFARWVGQFEEGVETEEAVLEVAAGVRAELLFAEGTYVAEVRPGSATRLHEPDWAMFAAFVAVPEGPLYIKLVGPRGELAPRRAEFTAWIESFRVAKEEGVVDRFAADLERICLENGRTVGSPGHREVEAYLEGRLNELGLAPYDGTSFRLEYERDDVSFVNLVAVLPGTDRALAPVLIGAHYDSVIDAPCADDNAAAVVIALEAARVLGDATRPRDVVIALFDAEEPPYFHSDAMGSTRFFHDDADARGFHAALILDLVGHDVALPIPGGDAVADAMFVTGAESHAGIAAAVEPRLAREGLRVVAALNDYVGDMSDHHVFRENGVPYLFLSCGRWEHYHMPTDTVDRLNPDKMGRIAEWLVEVARDVAAADLEGPPPDGDFTLELECRSISAVLASLDPRVLAAVGLSPPTTREEMDTVARALLDAGL